MAMRQAREGNETARFRGKAAIVTGAASGIGGAIARRLAREGARVGLVDVDGPGLGSVQKEIAASGGEAATWRVDIREPQSVERMARDAFSRWRQVDYLVNNAGIYPTTPFLEITEPEWDRVLDTNLKGPFLCAQAVCRRMVKGQVAGRVVNIGSTASVLARPGIVHYAASKAGLNMMTRVLALELAPYGIQVNAVCPGLVATPRALTMARPANHRKKLEVIPLRREGRLDEITSLVCFLLSDEASYCTGGLFFADGGYTAGLTAYGGRTAGPGFTNRGHGARSR